MAIMISLETLIVLRTLLAIVGLTECGGNYMFVGHQNGNKPTIANPLFVYIVNPDASFNMNAAWTAPCDGPPDTQSIGKKNDYLATLSLSCLLDCSGSYNDLNTKGVTLSTDLPSSLIVATVSNKANDAMVVPSVDQLGTEYMIVTSILYTVTPAGSSVTAVNVGPFVFAIMATANNTVVTVQCNTQDPSLKLTYGRTLCTKGGSMNLTLNATQTVQAGYVPVMFTRPDVPRPRPRPLLARPSVSSPKPRSMTCLDNTVYVKGPCCGLMTLAGGDPTGSVITSNYPIFVSAGAGLSCVDASCVNPNHLTESIPPISQLGSRYVIIPSQYGDIVKIVAVSGNTSYTARLLNGITYTGTLALSGSSNTISMLPSDLIFLTSTSPVLVSQFSKTMTYMFIPTAVDRPDVMTSSYAFTTFKTSGKGDFDDDYVSVAIATSDIPGLQLDGAQVTASGFTAVGSSGFSATTIAVSHGLHTLTHACSKPFTGFIHSYKNDMSETAGTGLPSWNRNYVNPGYCVVMTTQLPTSSIAVSTSRMMTSLVTTSVTPTTTRQPSTTSPVATTAAAAAEATQLHWRRAQANTRLTSAVGNCFVSRSPLSCAAQCDRDSVTCRLFQYDVINRQCCLVAPHDDIGAQSLRSGCDVWMKVA